MRHSVHVVCPSLAHLVELQSLLGFVCGKIDHLMGTARVNTAKRSGQHAQYAAIEGSGGTTMFVVCSSS